MQMAALLISAAIVFYGTPNRFYFLNFTLDYINCVIAFT